MVLVQFKGVEEVVGRKVSRKRFQRLEAIEEYNGISILQEIPETESNSFEYCFLKTSDRIKRNEESFAPINEIAIDSLLSWLSSVKYRLDGPLVERCGTYSAEAAPRVPAEKLSTKRTVLCSRGTVVPPDCGCKPTQVNRSSVHSKQFQLL